MNAAADRIRWHLAVEDEANAERTPPEQDCAEELYRLLSRTPDSDEIIRVLRIAYLRGYTAALKTQERRLA